MKCMVHLVLAILTWGLFASQSTGATIVTYNFSSGASATNASPAITGGNVTPGSLTTFNPSDSAAGSGALFASSPVLTVSRAGSGPDTLAEAISANSYFTITITGNSGPYSLDGIDLNAARGATSNIRGFTVRSSLTGTTDLIRDDQIDNTRPNWTPYSADLTSYSAFDSITGDVTFTFYVYNSAASNVIHFDDIEFSGAELSVVPEPASLALLGAGLLGLALYGLRRRKR